VLIIKKVVVTVPQPYQLEMDAEYRSTDIVLAQQASLLVCFVGIVEKVSEPEIQEMDLSEPVMLLKLTDRFLVRPFYNKYDRANILLRRDEVKRLSDQGLNQTEISEKIEVTQACASMDLQYIQCKAEERMKEHIEKTIPSVHAMCEDGFQDSMGLYQ
jgi:hypothetical protein